MNHCSEAPANVNINAGFKDSSKATGSLGVYWAPKLVCCSQDVGHQNLPGNGPGEQDNERKLGSLYFQAHSKDIMI